MSLAEMAGCNWGLVVSVTDCDDECMMMMVTVAVMARAAGVTVDGQMN